MTITTHIAASCILTLYTVSPVVQGFYPKMLMVTLGALLMHFVLDIIPHGFIATPWTIFKKPVPTIIELVPGPAVFAVAIELYGNAVYFLVAVFFGILPDVITTLCCKNKYLFSSIPVFRYIHLLHRKVHWFETEHSDGTISYRFPNKPLLVIEGVFLFFLIAFLLP